MGQSCSSGTRSSQDLSKGSNHEHKKSYREPDNKNKKTVVALFDYQAVEPQDVSFSRGDCMLVIEERNDNTWIQVKHLGTKKKGFAPANFVAVLSSLECETWFFKNTSRKDAENLLMNNDNRSGTFLIRTSKQDPTAYALSIKDGDNKNGYLIKHYKIICTDNTEFYISTNKRFESLQDLICVYSRDAFGLCQVLRNPCPKPYPRVPDLSSKYRDKWEILREEIELHSEVGKGSFGLVYYGRWRGERDVAVKMLQMGKMSNEEFLKEASVMKRIRHKKLVQLYGVCSLSEPLFIVQEFMTKGSVESYIRQDRGRTLKFDGLVNIAYQVACGMAHLESLKFIHRDLAARNVLLGENFEAKICDFGLTKVLEPANDYVSKARIPIKWTAPEALKDSKYSTKSDVWSYGIFLMELFTYGATPYEKMHPLMVYELVCHGYRMPKPDDLPDEIYEVMETCWHENPEKRPTFKSLEQLFENIHISYRDGDSSVVLNQGKGYEDHKPLNLY